MVYSFIHSLFVCLFPYPKATKTRPGKVAARRCCSWICANENTTTMRKKKKSPHTTQKRQKMTAVGFSSLHC